MPLNELRSAYKPALIPTLCVVFVLLKMSERGDWVFSVKKGHFKSCQSPSLMRDIIDYTMQNIVTAVRHINLNLQKALLAREGADPWALFPLPCLILPSTTCTCVMKSYLNLCALLWL